MTSVRTLRCYLIMTTLTPGKMPSHSSVCHCYTIIFDRVIDHLRTIMAVELPFEIWRQVASYLPTDCLTALYSVNRPFFELAMEERYNTVRFEHPDEIAKNFDFHFRLPMALRRVRSLHVSPQMMHIDSVKGWKGLLAKTFRKRLYRAISTGNAFRKNLDFITGLTGVTSLKISCPRHMRSSEFPDLVRLLPVFTAGRICFGGTLCSLTLQIPRDGCPVLLTPTMVFPSLKRLKVILDVAVTLRSASPGVAPRPGILILYNILAPFINNHRPTLRSLSLSLYHDVMEDPTIPVFLTKLHHFPHLTGLMLGQDFVSATYLDSSALQYMLELHADNIRELTLHPIPRLPKRDPPTHEWYERGFFLVRLLNLEHLELRMGVFPNYIRMFEYLHQFGNSLTSLHLVRGEHQIEWFSYSEVEHLVDAFSRQGLLKTLSIYVALLTPHLLSLLAAKLPQLEILSLRFRAFSSIQVYLDSAPTTSILFEKVVSGHRHGAWRLQHFTGVHVTSTWPVAYEACEKAIRAAIPSLQTMELSWCEECRDSPTERGSRDDGDVLY
ncbi:hypothetical protein FPV67DRAFT_1165267 [Lyophyllum atratum]|nr:hypothetical protein FPV67DRAFT_1165267 [Lyophyllum atratum]